MRTMWQRYYETARAIIFVVDSNYRDGIEQARQELHRLINEPEIKSKPLLILANKQDLPNAMTINELRDKLALSELDENLKWHLQATSAIRNQGLKEGFEWLASLLKKIFNKFMQF
jgi:signal recognition particle receptor subunit beta